MFKLISMHHFKILLLTLILCLNFFGIVAAQRTLPRRQIITLTDRDKELTSLIPEDKAKFAAFLELPHTGFVRIHDSALCEEKSSIVSATEPCPYNITGKATSYSFRKEAYRTAFYSDIKFKNSNFQIVGVNMLGFLTNLGDVPLEKITLQTDGVKEMAEFEPSVDIKEVESQINIVRKGFKIGDFLYRTWLPMKENNTYALRCIAYQSKIYQKINSFKVDMLDFDKRVDVTVVFRVIRKHDDGSVSILWKELSRKDAPKLVFPRDVK
jgi:hypothetical protein